MTATPIPRTLALTAYGDMDVFKILDAPPGRKTIDTRLMSAERLGELVTHLRLALDRGDRAYWVCPWWRSRKRSTWPPPKNAPRCCKRRWASPLAWCMAR